MIAALARIARLIFRPDRARSAAAAPCARAEAPPAPVALGGICCEPVAPTQTEIIDLVARRRARQIAATDREIARVFG